MAETRKPNVFLLGAPKCGTTTIVRVLAQHSKVFLPYPKETDFWSTDMKKSTDVTDLKSVDDYLALFAKCPEEKTHLLDGSTTHLFSEVAVDNILGFQPDAYFIIMLRNPVAQVQSLHQEQLFSMNEDEPDFWTAWTLQEKRARGENIPKSCADPLRLLYARQGALGDQLERAMNRIPPERLFIGFLDDMQRDFGGFYDRLTDFLELGKEELSDIGAVKSSRQHRFQGIARLYQSPPAAFAPTVRVLKKALRRNGSLTQRLAQKILVRDMPRTELTEQQLAALHDVFAPQIRKIAALTGRDLSGWQARAAAA
ncbi:sulfotransferase family protein [Amaricoccus solimangrovi]|uniref:Sulfotransferase n=1 Tax=Amaricoccus solimangrovi TaxID=2589815 RepID=A0A501WL50_9RHOB|nr:sulfotransferase [Amaricoccus solimangrovi]TPE49120.1 sulfotransferase [Amaricoccus solimangrovi]